MNTDMQYDIGTADCHIVKAECITCGHSTVDPATLEMWNAYGNCPDYAVHADDDRERTLWIMSDHTASYVEVVNGEQVNRIDFGLDESYTEHAGSALLWTILTQNMRPEAPVTPAKSSVQRLLRVFADAGIDADWAHTGGGCFAIQIDLDPARPEYDYLLITDYEDVLSDSDYESDQDRYGWALGRYVHNPREGYAFGEAEAVSCGRMTVYRTPNLDAIDTLVAVVRTELTTVITWNMCMVCHKAAGSPNRRHRSGQTWIVCEQCHEG